MDEIVVAAHVGLRAKGRRDAAEIVKQVSNFSPQRATKIKKSIPNPNY